MAKIGNDWMRGKRESTRVRRAGSVWPRRALVSLWLLAFVLVGGALAARWDAVMARLAGPPATGGAVR
jgi:type VI protein secretion system component VasF